MKDIVIDTDILIGFLRGKSYARDYLLSVMDECTLHCSVLTVAEIHAGMKESEREKTQALLYSLNVVNVGRAIAEKAGAYKREEKRQHLALDDCLVAATAFNLNAVLATGNGKHYPMSDITKIIVSARGG